MNNLLEGKIPHRVITFSSDKLPNGRRKVAACVLLVLKALNRRRVRKVNYVVGITNGKQRDLNSGKQSDGRRMVIKYPSMNNGLVIMLMTFFQQKVHFLLTSLHYFLSFRWPDHLSVGQCVNIY